MSVKTRLNKLEEQTVMPEDITVWIALQHEDGSDQYNVSKSGVDGSQVLSLASVRDLPGAVLAIHLAPQPPVETTRLSRASAMPR